MSQLPVSHQFDAHELESAGYMDLFKIEFLEPENSYIYLSPMNEVEWLDQTWEELPCKLSDVAQNSSGEMNRPKFSVANPAGLFSTWIEKGLAEGALVTRYRVLLSDFKVGNNAYAKSVWVLSKVVSLNKDIAVFELRSTLDGTNFTLPARSFYPPDFPSVRLQ